VSTETIREAVRQSVADELRPVRPLPAVWKRWLVVLAVTTVICTAALTMVPFRADMGELPMWLSWGCSLLQLLIGLALVALALREAVPGHAAPLGVLVGVAGGGTALQVIVGLATWMHSTGASLDAVDAMALGMGCLKHDSVMALPVLVVTLVLVFRALPMRAPVAGMLGGAGAGIGADAVTHLLCPFSALRHVLVWHTGAIVLLAITGWAVGVVWEKVRWRG
jgi:hypothetical protein